MVQYVSLLTVFLSLHSGKGLKVSSADAEPTMFYIRMEDHYSAAPQAAVQVKEQTVFEGFWHLLEDNLWNRFHARPVHSLTEIQLLHSRFPNNIRLFVVEKENELLGGTVLYVCGKTVKTQYISANEKGKQMHVLDLLFDQLLQKFADEGMSYFDFGTSNKDVNDDLNDSLIFQKEGFGGRAVCYDTYEWKLQGTH